MDVMSEKQKIIEFKYDGDSGQITKQCPKGFNYHIRSRVKPTECMNCVCIRGIEFGNPTRVLCEHSRNRRGEQ